MTDNKQNNNYGITINGFLFNLLLFALVLLASSARVYINTETDIITAEAIQKHYLAKNQKGPFPRILEAIQGYKIGVDK